MRSSPEVLDGVTRAVDRPRVARAVVGFAFLLGLAADALLRDGPIGIGASIWVALAVLTLIALTWRADRSIPREAAKWMMAAVFFGALLSWRGDEMLQGLNLVSAMFALGMTTVTIAGSPVAGIFSARVRDVILSALTVAGDALGGVISLVASDGALTPTKPTPDRARFRVATRAILITVPVVVVFAALLMSADPIFASLFTLPKVDVGLIVSHIVVVGFFAWTSAGWARRAALVNPATPYDLRSPVTLGATEITAVLGSLVGLFAAFVIVQLGWLFGGEALLRTRTGLTVAEYARRGFFELVWVALLVVGVLLTTRALASGDRRAERRHTALGLPLVGLVGAIMASAAGRMKMYVSYYGLTSDRFYAVVFMAWLAVVLVWLAATVLRGWGRPFVAGSVMAGLVGLAGLNAADPSAFIAQVNLHRAGTARLDARGKPTSPVDLSYLAQLSDGAIPLVVAELEKPFTLPADSVAREATLVDRCSASRSLERYVSGTDHDARAGRHWRMWNSGRARARALLAAHQVVVARAEAGCPRRDTTTTAR